MGLANWYEETVLSKVIALGCGGDEVTELRSHVVPLAQGSVFGVEPIGQEYFEKAPRWAGCMEWGRRARLTPELHERICVENCE